MIDETLETLRLYLAGDLDFEALERHIVQLAPDAEGEHRALIDCVAAEIFYVWDGESDEALFRERVADICVSQPASSTA